MLNGVGQVVHRTGNERVTCCVIDPQAQPPGGAERIGTERGKQSRSHVDLFLSKSMRGRILTMPKVSVEVLNEVNDALRRYEAEVEDSLLRRSTKDTYLLHARHFVRWLDNDFESGASLRDYET